MVALCSTLPASAALAGHVGTWHVVKRASVASDGSQANRWSFGSAVSGDGGIVAFTSMAGNLVPGDDNGTEDVFVRDRATGRTERVSVASDGTEADALCEDAVPGAVCASGSPAVSRDGRIVAFSSVAGNLVPGDDNGSLDVFVHDRVTGSTERISVASDGAQANFHSDEPAVSRDGRIVAFSSVASNLVPGDDNGSLDVFVHDRATGSTERISVASDGTQGNFHSERPAVSGDGRIVAFSSEADDLVPGDTNDGRDVFVHDRATGSTERISVASDGTQGNTNSVLPRVSGDGRVVAFVSFADNLVPDDSNVSDDVFVHDRVTGSTERISVASDGTQGNNESFGPAVSRGGRIVAFSSEADNLVPGDSNDSRDVFVHDRATGHTKRVSVARDGTQANDESRGPAVSGDGRIVAFTSEADNLVPGDTNGADDFEAGTDVFVAKRTVPSLPGCTITGSAGDDLLIGTSADDVLCGMGGHDRLRGRGGDDRLRGGRGQDRLRGGRGPDRLFGGFGDDLLRGGPGPDRLRGGPGDDRLYGGPGDDWLRGGPGRDRLRGRSG
jgi:Tol biopolymer transport system component